jgi:CheY-like chemotaxis protein
VREPDEPATPADVAADIEHELTNSLASIVGFSQVIRRDPSLPEDLRRSANLLLEEATRTRRLVQRLLDEVRQPAPSRATDGATATIPQSNAHAPPTTTHTGPSSATPPAILVLDDEPSFRVFLEKALPLLGYRPVLAVGGPEAIELARSGRYAAVLCDHQMPGVSGTDVYEALVAVRPELATRFVIMSGDVLDPRLEAFAATHDVTLLAKPFGLDTLDRTLRSVIEAAGQPRG